MSGLIYNLLEEDSKAWLWAAAGIAISEGADPYKVLLPKAVEIAEKFVPDRIIQQLKQMNQPDGPTSMLIKGLPIDPNLPASPTDGKRPVTKSSWISEATLLGTLGVVRLEAFSYAEQKSGALVQEIVPVNGLESSNSNAGRTSFGPHSDDASLLRSYRPEGIALLCLRNDSQTKTWFASIDDILEAIDPYYVDILRSRSYRVRTPESFNYFEGKIIFSEPRQIISKGLQGQDEIAVALYNVQPSNNAEELQMALNALRLVLKPPVAKAVILEPGDLFIFSNVRGLHFRDSIVGERWLQRTYFRQSLEQLQQATNTDEFNRTFETRQLVLE